MPVQHFNVLLFSNPGENVLKRWKTMGQICPLLLTRIRIFPPGLEDNYTLKCWSGNFPTSLIYVIKLENCQNNISMYRCSPIQEEKILILVKILLKLGSQSATYTFPLLSLLLDLFLCFWSINQHTRRGRGYSEEVEL